MVRVFKSEDGSRWIVRRRMHLETRWNGVEDNETDDSAMQREIDCLRLMKGRTSVLVPCIPSSSWERRIRAPIMLMEWIPGNVDMDLDFHPMPSSYKSFLFEEMARIWTGISSITFPKIEPIIRLEDGSYDVESISRTGGTFETGTEYFKAWRLGFPQPLSVRIIESWGYFAENNFFFD